MSENHTLKALAEAFLRLTASGKIAEAYARYIGDGFIHHNQYFKGDKASLMHGMQENADKFTDKSLEMKAAVQEGDRVVTYSHVRMGDMHIAVFHMFRFKDGKVVELWDVGQPIAKDSPNKNGMF
jgi:predicted SnoaL-like aldol condensation-catalyzing enzyme